MDLAARGVPEVVRSHNSLEPQKPYRLLISSSSSSMLEPGDSVEVPFILHTEITGSHDLYLFFLFREVWTISFVICYSPDFLIEWHSTILSNKIDPFIWCSSVIEYLTFGRAITDAWLFLCREYPHSECVDDGGGGTCADLLSKSFVDSWVPDGQWTVSISQLYIVIHSDWVFNSGVIAPSQCFGLILGASSWSGGSGSRETADFVAGKLRQLLQGKDIDPSTPPHIDVHCSHVSKVNWYNKD